MVRLTVPASRARFQSLSVFSSAETRLSRRRALAPRRFNPYRVFSSAETRSPCDPGTLSTSFNPYRVFSSAETDRPGPSPAYRQPSFNPYRVFSSAETQRPGRTLRLRHVSIPIGFSHQLRLSFLDSLILILVVSIPIGFSHQLRRGRPHPPHPSNHRFQSLSGFLIS